MSVVTITAISENNVSPDNSPDAAAPAPVKQEPVGHGAKRIFLIHVPILKTLPLPFVRSV